MRGVYTLLSFKKLRICFNFLRIQILGAKVYSQEGNSPDYLLRSLIVSQVIRVFKY